MTIDDEVNRAIDLKLAQTNKTLIDALAAFDSRLAQTYSRLQTDQLILDKMGQLAESQSAQLRQYVDNRIAGLSQPPQPPPTSPPVDPPPVTPPASYPSGVAPPARADYQGWKIVDVLDFTTPKAKGQFGPKVKMVPAEYSLLGVYEDGWKDTAGKNYGQPSLYMPSQVLSVANGCLVKDLFNDGQGARSAAVQVGGNQLGGRYTIRARMFGNAGWKVAWLLWPQRDSDWPKFGEIDFPEANILSGSKVGGYLHIQNGGSSGQGQMGMSSPALLEEWNTYTTEWLPPGLLAPSHPGFVRHYVNDTLIFTCTDALKVPAGPMHWVVQTESTMGGPYSTKGARARVEIDWLGLWKAAV